MSAQVVRGNKVDGGNRELPSPLSPLTPVQFFGTLQFAILQNGQIRGDGAYHLANASDRARPKSVLVVTVTSVDLLSQIPGYGGNVPYFELEIGIGGVTYSWLIDPTTLLPGDHGQLFIELDDLPELESALYGAELRIHEVDSYGQRTSSGRYTLWLHRYV